MRVILNAVFFHDISDRRDIAVARFGEGGAHDAGAGNADVDDTVRLAGAVEGAGHEGLSSGALQKTTSFAAPMQSRSAVAFAVSRTIWPMRSTASMLMPDLVVPMLTDEQTSLRFRECLRDTAHEGVVAGAEALVHKGAVAADEVDADGVRGAIERFLRSGWMLHLLWIIETAGGCEDKRVVQDTHHA